MIQLSSIVDVVDLTGEQISEFMLNCTDEDYQKWWPGVHLAFHTVRPRPNNVGSIVYFDEYIDRYRLKFKARIVSYLKGQFIEWRLEKILPLPAMLSIKFKDSSTGVRITHIISMGFSGIGRILDPIIRRLLPKDFESLLNEHAHYEFKQLSRCIRIEKQ